MALAVPLSRTWCFGTVWLSLAVRHEKVPAEHRTGFYRFGLAFGPDNALYFPNGTSLMRMKW